MVRQEMFSGSLPSPEQLEKYDLVLPGSAERIMKMAEQQGEHRRSLESRALDGDCRAASRGQTYAFILTVGIIVGGVVLALLGKQITGTVFGGVGLAATAGVFVYSSRSRRRERETKYGIPPLDLDSGISKHRAAARPFGSAFRSIPIL